MNQFPFLQYIFSPDVTLREYGGEALASASPTPFAPFKSSTESDTTVALTAA
jgi:hypothetical protein